MDTINIIIRIVSTNEDIDVDLPPNATAMDVIETLLDNNIAPRNDDAGNPITYRLTPKTNREIVIEEDETLEEVGIKEGDFILMTPVFVAGL